MSEIARPSSLVRFGVFELNLQGGELRNHGLKVKLQEKPFQILAILLNHPGEVVTREELRRQLWPADTFVDFDHSVNTAINKLREALGDSAENPRFIETQPRHGYRFIAPTHAAVGAIHESPLPVTIEERHEDSLSATAETAREVPPHASPKKLWLAGLGLGVVGLLAVILFRTDLARRGPPAAAPIPAIHSLAVLPLENLSGDPGQQYLADGMTDELITTLGQVSALRVISRTSVMQYKGAKKPLPEIARELNVDAIVEGSVLRSGDRVRITANLLYAPTDRHLWSETYERNLGDVLALQSEVARAIVTQIRVKVTPQEQVRLASARPVNPEAHRLYVLGRFYLNKRTEKSYKPAIDHFQQAIEIDPGYTPAYTELAESYVELNRQYLAPPKELFPKVRAAARKALEIDPASAEAHAALACSYFEYDWDWAAAEKDYKRAIELNPNSAMAHQRYSVYLSSMKRYAEGIREAQRAQQLDPLSPWMSRNLAICYIYAREFDQALQQCRDTASLFPEYSGIYQDFEAIYIAQHRYQEAVAARQKGYLLGGMSAAEVATLGQAYAKDGVRGYWLWQIRRWREESKHRYVPASWFAYLFAGLGDKDQAFSYMEKAYQERDRRFTILQVAPGWDPLRSDPRFQVYLRRMNFPP
ncbi:MAG: winged helix-turn-helix domain-containing protein [Acidobacteria bacterium]|nr:winged helix-turn-helix domain-containing protein [Acidobacteriota bacterium]